MTSTDWIHLTSDVEANVEVQTYYRAVQQEVCSFVRAVWVAYISI